jgi:hypothetical protein
MWYFAFLVVNVVGKRAGNEKVNALMHPEIVEISEIPLRWVFRGW